MPPKGSNGPGFIRSAVFWFWFGFTYFVNLDVSFSIGFFTVLTMLQEYLFNRFGYKIPHHDVYTLGHPGIGRQSFGAMIVLLVSMLWITCGRLGAIWRKAIDNHSGVDDSDELMFYRMFEFGGEKYRKFKRPVPNAQERTAPCSAGWR